MGVASLLKLLSSEGSIKSASGDTAAHHLELVRDVTNKVVAVDVSCWIMEAEKNPELDMYSRGAAALKLIFERVINWLRFGVVPVGVLEGLAPKEKLQRQQQRFQEAIRREEERKKSAKSSDKQGGWDQAPVQGVCTRQGGGCGSVFFNKLGTTAGELMAAMGCPVVRAPGEAEAMCAALNGAGAVDGVASLDTDTLLFGAEHVYLKMKLLSHDPPKCKVQRCSMSDIRRMLGIALGGSTALIAMALLAGGDYDIDGAERVGPTRALFLVKQLLQGKQDDSQLLNDLRDLLTSQPDDSLLRLTHCTGCRQCGHDTCNTTRQHSSRNICRQCGDVGAGIPCVPRRFDTCGCEFHTKYVQRWVDKIVRRAQGTKQFHHDADIAERTYLREARTARNKVEYATAKLDTAPGEKLRWLHRPYVEKVAQLLTTRLSWDEEVDERGEVCRDEYGNVILKRWMEWDVKDVRRKMMTLLLEWDLTQGGPGRQFVPQCVKSYHKQRTKVEQECWRVILEWQRLDDGTPEVAADRVWLSPSGSTSEARTVAIARLQQHWPTVWEEFMNRREGAAAKKLTKEERARQRAESKLAKDSSAGMQQLMKDFLRPSKLGTEPQAVVLHKTEECRQSRETCSSQDAAPGQGQGLAHALQAVDDLIAGDDARELGVQHSTAQAAAVAVSPHDGNRQHQNGAISRPRSCFQSPRGMVSPRGRGKRGTRTKPETNSGADISKLLAQAAETSQVTLKGKPQLPVVHHAEDVCVLSDSDEPPHASLSTASPAKRRKTPPQSPVQGVPMIDLSQDTPAPHQPAAVGHSLTEVLCEAPADSVPVQLLDRLQCAPASSHGSTAARCGGLATTGSCGEHGFDRQQGTMPRYPQGNSHNAPLSPVEPEARFHHSTRVNPVHRSLLPSFPPVPDLTLATHASPARSTPGLTGDVHPSPERPSPTVSRPHMKDASSVSCSPQRTTHPQHCSADTHRSACGVADAVDGTAGCSPPGPTPPSQPPSGTPTRHASHGTAQILAGLRPCNPAVQYLHATHSGVSKSLNRTMVADGTAGEQSAGMCTTGLNSVTLCTPLQRAAGGMPRALSGGSSSVEIRLSSTLNMGVLRASALSCESPSGRLGTPVELTPVNLLGVLASCSGVGTATASPAVKEDPENGLRLPKAMDTINLVTPMPVGQAQAAISRAAASNRVGDGDECIDLTQT